MSDRLRGRVARPHELTVVTVGDSKVGKTALINRFCDDVFIEVCEHLIRFSFLVSVWKVRFD